MTVDNEEYPIVVTFRACKAKITIETGWRSIKDNTLCEFLKVILKEYFKDKSKD